MIGLELFLAFLATCVLLAIVPGPSMALFVATSTTRGVGAGMTTLAGNSVGLTILVAAAIFGMAPLLALAADWFDYIRLAGAAYLVWIGITYIRKGLSEPAHAASIEVPRRRLFMQALAVALSNPKVLIFLGAFFPQFINPGQPLLQQLVILGISFVVTLSLVDAMIVLASGYARKWLLNRQRTTHIASGVLLMGAGALLAFARK